MSNWTNFFRSRYVRYLEERLAKHDEETEQLKKAHAEELSRCMVEANRGWAEADRLRQYLFPGLAPSTRATETADSSPNKEPVESGTPFQRMARRVMDEDRKQYEVAQAARKAKEEAAKLSNQAAPAAQEN